MQSSVEAQARGAKAAKNRARANPQPKRPRGTAEHAKYAEGGRRIRFLSFPRVLRIQRFSSLLEYPRGLRAIWTIAVLRAQRRSRNAMVRASQVLGLNKALPTERNRPMLPS